jgi:cytochrome P450
MAYDIISELGFGAPLGFVDAGKDVHGLIQGFHDGNPLFGIMARMHPFTTMAKKTWLGKKYLVSRPGDQTGIGVLMKTRDRLIAQRLEDIDRGETKTRVDLLQTFLDARTEEGNPLEMEYIKAEILLVLLAGADTTGTAFQAMVHYIFGAPEAHRRIMEEIDDADRKGLLSRMPQYDEIAANCPFYIASIHEAMRLCPSAPNIFPRVVSEPGLDLNGKFAPSGTEITCNPWLTGRDKTLYGEDAEVYRPDRWLENEQAARDFHK